MPPIDKHAPGSFCWFELATTDQPAAKKFYESLFGWTSDDQPLGPGEFYTMFKIGGRTAAAGHTMGKEELATGAQPHWNLYISVADVDASTKRAAELGGSIIGGPFNVMTAGRMAIIQDPTGVPFQLWQAGDTPGTGVVNEPGAGVWADLNTPDPAKAAAFYSALLGWKFVKDKTMAPAGAGDYGHIVNGADFIGGLPPPHDPPAHWLIYFAVANGEAAVAKAKSLGATVWFGPVAMKEIKSMSVLSDPQGAVFAIVQK